MHHHGDSATASRIGCLVSLLVLLVLAGCGGGSGGSGGGGDPGPCDASDLELESISLSPDTLIVDQGGRGELSVTAHLGDEGCTTTALGNVDWTASSNSVEIDGENGTNGVTTEDNSAVITGTALLDDVTITAEFGDQTAQATVRVAILRIEPENITLPAGFGESLTARLKYADGSEEDVTTEAEWESSNDAIALADQGSLDAPTDAPDGSAIVHAQHEGADASVTVNVAGLDTIEIDQCGSSDPCITIGIGEPRSLTVTGSFGGVERDVTHLIESWVSDKTEIASINDDGVVTGEGAGEATITAALADRVATAKVEVVSPTLTSMEILCPNDPPDSNYVPCTPPINLTQGANIFLKAEGTFDDTPVPTTVDLTTEVEWSSDSENIASVSNDEGIEGRVSGLMGGDAGISANLSGNPGVGNPSVNITVIQDETAPADITVVAEPNALVQNASGVNENSTILRAFVTPNDPENEKVDPGTEVEFSIVAGSGTLGSPNPLAVGSNEEATVTLDPTASVVTVRAEIPNAGLSDTVNVYRVGDFPALFLIDTDGTDLQCEGGNILEGSRFTAVLYNGSNREFAIDGIRLENDEGPVHSTSGADSIAGGSFVSLVYELGQDRPDQGFMVSFDLTAALVGSMDSHQFSVEHVFDTCP